MYTRVWRMIFACSYGLMNRPTAAEAQTDLLALLRRYEDCQYYSAWPQFLLRAGIQFVESTAWGMLWARLRYEHGRQDSELSSTELANLEAALQEHFQPILSELPKMSDIPQITHDEAREHIALACVAGCDCEPQAARGAVVDKLTASFGPVITEIIALIKSGLTNLPAILAALQAAGVVLPPWINMLVTLLLAIVPKAAVAGV